MSRWIERFNNHPFRASWQNVKSTLANANLDDQTVLTSVAELGRLRKVISYLDGLLEAIDPELMPLSVLDSFNDQASNCATQIGEFNNNKNIGHIQNANSHADNLLTYIRPYMVAGGRTAKALRQAAAAYSEAMADYAKSFKTAADEMLASIQADQVVIGDGRKDVLSTKSALDGAKNEFLGNGESRGSFDEIKAKIAAIEAKFLDVSKLHTQLFADGDGAVSIKSQIEEAASNADQSSKSAVNLVQRANASVSGLEEFFGKVFGMPGADGKREGGVSADLDAHMKRLGDFEIQQKTKYSALNAQIESLLPGATTVGLASAYREMKETFDKPIRVSSLIFYCSVGALAAFAVVSMIDHVGSDGLVMRQLADWKAVLQSFAYKAPIFGPLIWLAFYASKRRSESQRLQQEYAHKEALAKSFDSYKKQIEELGEDDQSMLKMLMQSAIETIAHNASKTLDGKHGDKMPLQEMAEKAADKAIEVYAKTKLPVSTA